MRGTGRDRIYVVVATAIAVGLVTGGSSGPCSSCLSPEMSCILGYICGSQQTSMGRDVGEVAFEERLALDLSGLGADIEFVASAATNLGAAAERDGEIEAGDLCDEEIGDCEVCWELEGHALEGTATGFLSQEGGCENLDLLDGLPGVYEVTGSDLEISWSGDGEGRYDLDAVGIRVAQLTVVLDDDREVVYGASWELDLLTATTFAGELEYASLDLSYLNFDGYEWTVHVVASEGVLAGTATRDDGTMCSVTGAFDAVRVDCELL